MEASEIKFRGASIAAGELVYGDLIHGVGSKKGLFFILPNNVNLAYVKNCDPLDGVNVKRESVAQYTGESDKNGTEIFNKDIIEYEGNAFEVKFLNARFKALLIGRKDDTQILGSALWSEAVVRKS